MKTLAKLIKRAFWQLGLHFAYFQKSAPFHRHHLQSSNNDIAYFPKSAPFHRHHLQSLNNDICEAIDKHAGQISLAEAVGVLELVKRDIIEQHARG